MAEARVRGIYSTALTKLLLDDGFEIAQPSSRTRERFGLEELNEPPDLDIRDRRDHQGVHALGRAESVKDFKSLLQSHLLDVIIRRWPVTANGIYKGLIEDDRANSLLVDIGPAKGRIGKREVTTQDSKRLLVQVERARIGAKRPTLTTEVKIPGKYAILIPERRIKISHKIKGRRDRSRLLELGRELAPQKWGIIWRTAAKDQPPEKLEKEIAYLVEEGEAVLERDKDATAPAEIREGSHFLDVEFPALSKQKLDTVRRSITKTIDRHHYFKACGGNLSVAVDMAEKLLQKDSSTEEVKKFFRRTGGPSFPIAGSRIDVEHVKLDGRILHLGEASVEVFDEDESTIEFSRIIKGKGVYDGLQTRRQPGDRAVTKAKIGEWHYLTRYFSSDGRHKGTYINLNTPMEIYPHGVRYVDLEIDICIWPNGRVGRVDEEKLESAAAEGVVTQRLFETVKKKVRELMKTVARTSG